MNTINLMLPGTSCTYYGEEIGMTDHKGFSITDNRDPNRTPMQWNMNTSAGLKLISTFFNFIVSVDGHYFLKIEKYHRQNKGYLG